MNRVRQCQRCGAPLAGQAVDELCGNCLLKLALEPVVTDTGCDVTKTVAVSDGAGIEVPVAEVAGATIDRYKLREKLGEGGFGEVYVAEQEEPIRRRVALKVIKLGMDTQQVIARFEAERQALAMMDHPNIARVLDAGTTASGRPYFVMELVRGIRITDYCDQNHLSTKERLGLFIRICHAIQHAHQKGIIHRDIKPSNVLVTLHDGVPVPKVIDFGIAKAIEGRLTNATVYTQLHQLMGTPAYMSPEQAEMSGLDIDTRSDIYALGVLLYQLLTSKTPFDGTELLQLGIDEMRRTIREKEPMRPSTRLATLHGAELTTTAQRRSVEMPELIHLLKGDLDWVVMKCLEKDRTRRYETANGVAMDLNRHLDNEPVMARPPSTAYRFQKAFRRNKGAFAAAAAVLMALLAGLGLTAWQAVRAKNAEQAEKTHAGQARADRDRALRAEAEAHENALATRNAWGAARRAIYAFEISSAFQALAENNLGRARELLNSQRPKDGEEDVRGFEWRYLWQLCRGDEIATFSDQGAEAVAFSPDGRYVAYGHKTIVVRDAVSRQEIKRLPAKSSSLSFAPNARLLASGHDSGVSLWSTERWQIVRSLSDAKPPTLFSPDGRWLVTGVEEGFRVWDTQTWQPLGNCPGAPDVRHYARNAVAFSPDSQFLITVAGKSMPTGDHLRVWRLPGLERLPDLRQDAAEPGSVAFTVDGKQVVAGLWDGRIVVWDFATGKVVAARKGHTSLVTVVAMAADGRTFTTASVDRTIIRWDSVTFEPLARQRGHVAEVWSLALSPDGRTAASGSLDGTTKLWSAHAGRTEPVLDGASLVAGFAEGGRNLAAFATNSLCVWAPESGERVDFPIPVRPPPLNNNWGRPYAVCPGEPLGVRGCEDGKVEIWSLTNGTSVAEWSAHAGDIGAIAFSPDGKHLATGSTNGEVKLWDFTSRRQLAQFEPGKGQINGLAFSPDGATLAGSILHRRVWLWAAGTRKEIQLDGSEGDMSFVAFSGTGKLLVATTVELNEARLWELPSGKQAGVLKGHVAGISAAAFSADGKILATGGMDRKIKIWDVATRQELVTFPLGIPIPTLDFSADGRILAVGDLSSVGHGIQVLRAPSFEEIARTEAGERKEGKEP